MLREKFRKDAIDLPSFLEAVFVYPPERPDGTAVFLSSSAGIVPNALLHNLGFLDDPDIPKALQQISSSDWQYDRMTTSYFLSRDIVVPTMGGEMAQWREKLFAQMHRRASDAADFLRLPSNAVVELGSKVEI